MDEHDETEEFLSPQSRGAGEGVRIIGPEEAAEALETGQAAGRQPEDAPRFGDVPRPPEGPRPLHRFPLPDSVDPAEAVPRPPIVTDPDTSHAQRAPGTAWASQREDPEDGPAADDRLGVGTQPGGGSRRRAGRGLFGSGRAGRHAGGRTGDATGPPLADSWVDELTWSGSPLATPPQPSPAVGTQPIPDLEEPGLEQVHPGLSAGSVAGPSGPGISGVELPHWTDPPTGEVPLIRPTTPPGASPAVPSSQAGEDDLGAWADLPKSRASWRDREADWDDPGYEPAQLGGDGVRLGALDESREDPDDQYSFASLDAPANPRAPWGRDEPTVEDLVGDPMSMPTSESVAAAEGPEPAGGAGRVVRLAGGRMRGRSQGPPAGGSSGAQEPGGWVRVATGVGVGVLALLAFSIGSVTSLALVVAIVTLAASELFAVLRRAGYRPATLLALVGTIGIMVAAYLKGESGLAVVVAVMAVAVLLWYLAGIERARPTVNLAATMLGFVWVGFLGAYAALLLSPALFPHRHGIAFVLGAALATVAYDVGALVVGSRFGRRPLAPTISPHKTWEGTAGGVALCLLVSVIVVGQIHPWGHATALALGLVVSVVAPLGDLCESMVKRDLGIKDMGSLLPGHGGVLDRMDAMLFVMPATFYLVRVLNIG